MFDDAAANPAPRSDVPVQFLKIPAALTMRSHNFRGRTPLETTADQQDSPLPGGAQPARSGPAIESLILIVA